MGVSIAILREGLGSCRTGATRSCAPGPSSAWPPATPARLRGLLATALAEAAPDEPFTVPRLTGDQPWAIELTVAAGLKLGPGGALGVRGAPGPLAPYVPSGAWL